MRLRLRLQRSKITIDIVIASLRAATVHFLQIRIRVNVIVGVVVKISERSIESGTESSIVSGISIIVVAVVVRSGLSVVLERSTAVLNDGRMTVIEF